MLNFCLNRSCGSLACNCMFLTFLFMFYKVLFLSYFWALHSVCVNPVATVGRIRILRTQMWPNLAAWERSMIRGTLTLGAEIEKWEQNSSNHYQAWYSSYAILVCIKWQPLGLSVSNCQPCSYPCYKKQGLSSMNSLEKSFREINVGRRGRRAVNFSLGFSSWHTVTILNHFHALILFLGDPSSWGLSHSLVWSEPQW